MNNAVPNESRQIMWFFGGVLSIWVGACLLGFGMLQLFRIARAETATGWVVLVVLVAACFCAQWWVFGRADLLTERPLLRAVSSLVLALIAWWAAINTLFVLGSIVQGG